MPQEKALQGFLGTSWVLQLEEKLLGLVPGAARLRSAPHPSPVAQEVASVAVSPPADLVVQAGPQQPLLPLPSAALLKRKRRGFLSRQRGGGTGERPGYPTPPHSPAPPSAGGEVGEGPSGHRMGTGTGGWHPSMGKEPELGH